MGNRNEFDEALFDSALDTGSNSLIDAPVVEFTHDAVFARMPTMAGEAVDDVFNEDSLFTDEIFAGDAALTNSCS